MKRHITLLACLMLVIAMVFAISSCKPEEEHTHNYVDGKCECGETDPDYTEDNNDDVVPGCTEHAYTYEVTKAATCTEGGETTYTCTVCGESKVEETAPAGHSNETVAGKAPTCTEPGLSDGKKCTVCGEITKAQVEINASGHSFADGVCGNCGAEDPDYNGPKTYEWNFGLIDGGEAPADKTYLEAGTTYADGYFTIAGEVYYRYKDGAIYCVEVEKECRGAIQFTVSGTATVEVMFSSTGGSNTSWIGIVDAEGNIIANNEGIDSVTGANDGKTVVTYNLKAGTYSVVSPKIIDEETGKNPYSRAARVYYVNVTETPVVVNKLNVETTDTYSYIDEYTFTADAEGYYTFNLPAGLGFYSKAKYDSFSAPELDFYDNAEGGTVVIGLEAGESLVFYVGALTKGQWTIEWTFEAGEVENGSGPAVEIDTELELGTNTIYAPDGAFGNAVECTFVVTEEGTYTFSSNYLMAVISIDEMTSYRGQAYLTPGTYVVNVVYYTSSEGYYDLDISYDAPATGEPDGSEQFPYVWDSIPESVVVDYDVISGKVYYIFTATADGSITFTWPVEFDSWFDYYEIVDGNTTENNESGFMDNSHSFVVEAGKTYRVSLGSWSEAGSHTIAISFTACAHVWSEATCTVPATCANCGATKGDTAEHTSTVAEPDCANPDVCAVCEQVIGYFDHAWDEGVVNTPADCATETIGSMTLTCTVCGEVSVEDIYYYHEWVVDVENWATCTVNGRYEAHCSVCNAVDAYDIEAQGHYNYFLSCGDSGECMECGETFTLEHDTTFSPATCTEPAYCMNCWSYIGEALGHKPGAAATCENAQICEECYIELAPAIDHADENGDFKCDGCSISMLPADGEALTVEQALAVAAIAGTAYTTQKYYISGIVTNVYNTQYGNFYIKNPETGKQICIYGLYTWNKETRYDAMSYKPVEGDEITVYTILGMYGTTCQGKDAWLDEVVAHEHNYTSAVTNPTCLYAGYTTHTCSICNGSYTDTETEALGHTTDNGTCERCNMTVGGDSAAEPVTVSKSVKDLITEYGWTSSTTKQSFNLDDVVSVKINGGSNTGKAYNGDHIRIYATDSPAGTMTISVPEGYELVSIKITTQTGTYAFFNIDGISGDVCNKTVEVSGNSVVLNSVKNGSDGKQVRVTAIEVVYQIAD